MNRMGKYVTATMMAVLILMATGCGEMLDDPYKATGPAETSKAAGQLVPLPTLEETEGQVERVVEELASYMSSLIPGLAWTWMDERSPADCDPPYDRTQGQKVFLRNFVGSADIPDAVWPAVVARARELAAGLGATNSESMVDKPGDHDARFYSAEGTNLSVGSNGSAVISSSTGCRLPAAVKSQTGTAEPPSSGQPTR
ncbi:LppA family lipoprotein [Nocardia aurantia]|uniref:LppA family lipoprotein n=1 Tax=Nocardia aurantia TaxID=2585199 RepID=UPI0012951D27|nr:LppA family lipoprotein [Nocardia aurantia]